MTDRIPDRDSDDAEQERRDRFNDNQPTNEDRVRDHFAELDRRSRSGNHLNR